MFSCTLSDNSDKQRQHYYRGLCYRCQNDAHLSTIHKKESLYIPSGCYFCDALRCNTTPAMLMEINSASSSSWREIHYDRPKNTYYHRYESKQGILLFECMAQNGLDEYICPFCYENHRLTCSEEEEADESDKEKKHVVLTGKVCMEVACPSSPDCVLCHYEQIAYNPYQKAVFNYFHKEMMKKINTPNL